MRDTIEMAREVKMPYDFVTGEPIYLEKLKAFEALVRADERERVMNEPLTKAQCQRFEDEIRADERNRTWTQEHWTEYERSIAAAEREACAKVCESEAEMFKSCAEGANDGRYDWKEDGARDCAYAIRAREHT
jgi:predicted ArsR family transcriptional regulator